MQVIQAPAAIFHLPKLGQVVILIIALDNLLITKFREAYLLARNSGGTVITVSISHFQYSSSAQFLDFSPSPKCKEDDNSIIHSMVVKYFSE